MFRVKIARQIAAWRSFVFTVVSRAVKTGLMSPVRCCATRARELPLGTPLSCSYDAVPPAKERFGGLYFWRGAAELLALILLSMLLL